MALPLEETLVDCSELSSFMTKLNQLRKADDLIIVALNNELPTKSFPGCAKSRQICDKFREKLAAVTTERMTLIRRCESELQSRADEDLNVRRILRIVRNEADVDVIVSERSRKAVHDRCDKPA